MQRGQARDWITMSIHTILRRYSRQRDASRRNYDAVSVAVRRVRVQFRGYVHSRSARCGAARAIALTRGSFIGRVDILAGHIADLYVFLA